MDLRDAQRRASCVNESRSYSEEDMDEILDRMLLMSALAPTPFTRISPIDNLSRATNLVAAVKSRITELPPDPELFRIWHTSFTSLAANLTSLCLIPFLTVPEPPITSTKPSSSAASSRTVTTIDAMPILAAMAAITAAWSLATSKRTQSLSHHPHEHHQGKPSRPHDMAENSIKLYPAPRNHYVHSAFLRGTALSICDPESRDSSTCAGCTSLPKLLLAFTQANVDSLRGAALKPGAMASSWASLATAANLYYTCVLRFWNAGCPHEARLFKRLVEGMRKDIGRMECELVKDDIKGWDLWLWKLFVTAYALAITPDGAGEKEYRRLGFEEGRSDWHKEMMGWVKGRVRMWAAEGKTWQDVKGVLGRVVWPGEFPDEDLARGIWELSCR
jgi:hypothetical protein